MNDSVPASTLVADWPPPTRGRLVAAELSYLVLSFFLTLGLAIQQLNGQWSRDVFVHIAAIKEFSTEGFGATNPYIATDYPDAYRRRTTSWSAGLIAPAGGASRPHLSSPVSRTS